MEVTIAHLFLLFALLSFATMGIFHKFADHFNCNPLNITIFCMVTALLIASGRVAWQKVYPPEPAKAVATSQTPTTQATTAAVMAEATTTQATTEATTAQATVPAVAANPAEAATFTARLLDGSYLRDLGMPLEAVVVLVAIPFGFCASSAFWFFQTGVRYGRISTSWLILNLSAAVATVLSIVLYGEKVNVPKAVGFGLMLSAMLLLWWDRYQDEGKKVNLGR